jgi:Spy/CpxP family protein refolding chaperone
MHSGTHHQWKARRAEGFGVHAGVGCGSGHAHARQHEFAAYGAEQPGGSFGVRRPLRYLAFKLQLSGPQVAELATILNELKTERAQAAVDDRRTVTAFADVIAAETFDPSKAGEAADLRARSAEKLQAAVVNALTRIHTLLEPEQRARFAYLIRSGGLTL